MKKGNEVIKYTMYMSNIDSSFGQKEPDNLIDEYIVPLNNGVEVQVKEYEEKEEKIKDMRQSLSMQARNMR